MKKARTHPPETVALIVVVLAIAAGVISFTACGGAPEVDAQAIVEDSCAQAEAANSHDIRMEITYYQGDEHGSAVAEYRLSGEDYQIVLTLDDGNVADMRWIDGVRYYRENDGPWTEDVRGIGALSFPYSIDSLCPDLGHVTRVGEEMLDSTPVTHFRNETARTYGQAGNVDDSPSSDYSVSEDWDFWLDSTGLLVQIGRVVVVPAFEGDPGGRTESVSVISGVGEPNVITAPEIP